MYHSLLHCCVIAENGTDRGLRVHMVRSSHWPLLAVIQWDTIITALFLWNLQIPLPDDPDDPAAVHITFSIIGNFIISLNIRSIYPSFWGCLWVTGSILAL